MTAQLMHNYPFFFLELTALLINIPCGYIRENCAKFSGKWFFWIHASIPILIYLRISLKITGLLIPSTICLAVIGQILGSRWRRKQMTIKEKEQLQQIQDLKIPSQQKAVPASETLVVLLNMGGPKTSDDIESFQKHLFADPILIRFPMSKLFQGFFSWLLIKFRLQAVKERYQLIGGGSPIYASTENQMEALSNELKRRDKNIDITYCFNYSPPFPDEIIQKAKAMNKKFILPLSLYPHYSQATTGSNLHYLKKASLNIYPEVKILKNPSYYLHDGYIQAFTDRINEEIQPKESLDDFYLIFSAHGLPLYFLKEGDPYPFQISQTVAKILTRLERDHSWVISYQSAVGPLEWLKPSTEDVIAALLRRGRKKLLVVPVSFVGDHIETSCEIDIEYRQWAQKFGVEDFRMSKAIECHHGFIHALADSVEMALDTTQSKKVYSEIQN